MIQDIVWALVPMSGAGMSKLTPMYLRRLFVNLRVTRSCSSSESPCGSTLTPPFAPPNGTSATAHLNVIQVARPAHSSWVTCGEYLRPPL